MVSCVRFFLPLFACLLACSPVKAANDGSSIIDSVYLGASIHDFRGDEENGVDGNFEFRFSPFFGRDWRVEFLPTVGGSVSFDGETNTAYLGGTARYMLTRSFFIEGFLGFTVHDADTPAQSNGADLGCTLLFREGVGIGYRAGHHALSLYGSHISHGDILCDDGENDGLTALGIRYGYHF